MLVLTRKAGERVVIGQGITVTVIRSGRGRVHLGIAAPPEVRVQRAEVPPRSALSSASLPVASLTSDP
jgi:carbon storage regulator